VPTLIKVGRREAQLFRHFFEGRHHLLVRDCEQTFVRKPGVTAKGQQLTQPGRVIERHAVVENPGLGGDSSLPRTQRQRVVLESTGCCSWVVQVPAEETRGLAGRR
jgi:hypothetical protein